MTPAELILEIEGRGMELRAEGEFLRLKGPRSAMDLPLRQAIEAHKPALLKLLATRSESIPRVPRDQPLAASVGQEGLWRMSQFSGGSAAFNIGSASRLPSTIDLDLLRRVMEQLTRRHESLRTRFVEADGRVRQVIEAEPRIRLVRRDFPAGESDSSLRDETARSFDLAAEPPWRVTVWNLADGGFLFQTTFHHIIFDFWSQGIFAREMELLYAAYAQGLPDPLPPLAIQAADVAAWQQTLLEGPRHAGLVAWWRAQLTGLPPVLELPADRPRPRVRDFAGGQLRRRIDDPVLAGLRDICASRGATLFVGFIATIAAFLHRLTGQADFGIGTHILNRSRPEIAPLIGFLVDTHVLRADLRGAPGMNELVGRIRKTMVEVLAHLDLPFESLLEELNPPRDPATTPWLQVTATAIQMLGTDKREADSVPVPWWPARAELTFFLIEKATGAEVELVYSQARFDADTAECYLDALLALLESAVAEPERSVAQLPWQSAGERRWLATWNSKYSVTRGTLADQLRSGLSRAPTADAVIEAGTRLSQGELLRNAEGLAGRLAALGVGPDTVVAVFLPRSPELIVALVAVVLAGGAFLAIDPSEVPARRQGILEDARPAVLITRGTPPAGVDGAVIVEPTERGSAPLRAPHPEELAYLLYTSGSTGRPKGVRVRHRNIAGYLAWAVASYDVEGGRGAPLLGSVGFDGTLTSIFAPLVCGRAVFLVPQGEELDALTSADWPGDDFSFIKLTPSHLRAIEEMGGLAHVLSRTRGLVLGGEALFGADLRRAVESPRGVRIWNEYGPTEATVACALYEVPAGPLPERIPIGRPSPNARIWIVDEHLQTLPRGLPGEILIGGDAVAAGYHRRAEETEARFLVGPESVPSFRTGDRARLLPSGNLEYLGRVDAQIKLRGYRVEPEDIEAALTRMSGVERAAVEMRAGPDAPLLVAWLQLPSDPGAETLRRTARAHLALWLPAALIPDRFVWMAHIPLSASGKVDRAALPMPAESRAVSAAPVGGTVGLVATHMAELLGMPAMEPDDSFFAMGGHSLLAVRLVARLRAAGAANIGLRDVFEAPTPTALAARFTQWSATTAPGPLLPPNVIPLSGPNTGTPLFLLPPVAGTSAVYAAFAARLPSDRTVLGLECLGLASDDRPVDRVEDAAHRFADAVEIVQPSGSVALAGWSFGALLAWELAQELRRRGRSISLLALIDAAAIAPDLKRSGRLRELYQLWDILRHVPMPRSWSSFRQLGGYMGIHIPERVGQLLRRDAQRHFAHARDLVRGLTRSLRVSFANIRAQARYLAAPYDGDAVLFRCGDPGTADDIVLASARQLTLHGLEVVRVPGNHMSLILDPADAAILASHLSRLLPTYPQPE